MLNKEERMSLLKLARNTIYARLHRQPESDYKSSSDVLEQPCGAFVTLHKQGALRGCIGLVQAVKPLYQTVREMAVASAFDDPRFPPLRKDEFDDLELEISVMSPPRRITDVNEIEVGKHGIIIKRGYHQGLLLPQVAAEQGWDRDTFLEHTCYKAGLNNDSWKQDGTEIQIFSAEVFSEKEH
jgi:AmmeMemoRadiSam system protein A